MPGDYASLNESSVAGTVAAEYVGSERMKFSTRLEARRATSLDSYSHTAAVAYKLSPDWTLLLRNGVQLDKGRDGNAGDATRLRQQIGAAYRPVDNDRFNFLTRYEHRAERLSGAATSYLAGSAGGLDSGFLASGLRQDTHILSAHANWQPVSKLTLSGRYAFADHRRVQRPVLEELGPPGLRPRHVGSGPALGRRRAGLRHDRQGGARQTGFGVEGGYMVTPDVGVGGLQLQRLSRDRSRRRRADQPGRIPAPADEIRRIAVRGSGRMTMQSTLDRCPRKPRWLPALMIAARCCCHRWSRPMGNRGPSSTPALTSCSTGEPEDGTEWRAHVGRCPLRNRHPDRCMAGWQSTHPPRNSYGHMIEAGANKTTYGVAPNSGWPLSN